MGFLFIEQDWPPVRQESHLFLRMAFFPIDLSMFSILKNNEINLNKKKISCPPDFGQLLDRKQAYVCGLNPPNPGVYRVTVPQ